MATKQQATSVEDRIGGLIENTDYFVVQWLAGGKWKRSLHRSFQEARVAVTTSPDPRAKLIAVAEDGSKQEIARSDWMKFAE
jgi:hypothetical protein